jgi:hypothetical protein
MDLPDVVALIDKIKNFLRDQGIINIGREGGGEKVATAENLVFDVYTFPKSVKWM